MHKTYTGHPAALRQQQGFTLIELMIVVAIIAVIAGIGYPSYTQYVTKAKRSAMQGYMMQIASREEQYLADARTYATLATLGMTQPAETVGKYNEAVVTVVTATTDAGYIAGVALPQYIITATPIGAQLANDTKCGILTLNSVGTKNVKNGTGSASEIADCWS